MRVAVYTDAVYGRDDTGVHTDETFVVYIAGLRDHLDGVILAGRLDPAPTVRPYLLRADVEVFPLPYYPSLAGGAAAMRGMLGSLRGFWRLLDRVDGTLVFGPHPLAIGFAVLALARRKRVVLGVRQDMPAHMRARHPGRRVLHALTALLEGAWRLLARACPTVVVGSDLAERYRHARQVLTVSISPIDEDEILTPEAALARDDAAGPRRLLSVGRLEPEKNPLLLVEILRLLRERDPRWTLTVCGDGSLADALARAARAADLERHVELCGYVPLGQLRDHYRQAQVFLHVSWTEGVPQVLFEAGAAGLPIVATDVGGVAGTAGDAALLVPPGDALAAADAVERVAIDPTLRESLVRAGLRLARAHAAGPERERIARLFTGRPREVVPAPARAAGTTTG